MKRKPLVIVASTLASIAGILISWGTIEERLIAPYVNSLIYEECRVGIVVEEDGHRHYTHTDCGEYQPIMDVQTGNYYFIDKEGISNWCQ